MDYIKKEPIVEFITKGLNNPDKTKAYGYDAIEILKEIEYAPEADVEEVKHAFWRENKTEYMLYGCSNCDCRVDYEFNYCPNCGAKMDGGGKDDL
jgi:hypothetical protein